MENVAEEKEFYKNSFKIALKTLIGCFIVIMFSICAIFVLFPKLSAKINGVMGFSKLQEMNYQTIYARSGKIADLYNVIVFEQEQENYSKELKYINEITARNDYKSFCKSMDEASLKTITNKNLIPYSANVNSYLVSQKVVCLCKTNDSSVDFFVYKQLKNEDDTEISFSALVDYIYFDESLSKEQKQDKFENLLEIWEDSLSNTTNNLLESRISCLYDELLTETNINNKIIVQYSLMRLYRSKYFIYETLGDSVKQTENYNLYNNSKIQLESLVNS